MANPVVELAQGREVALTAVFHACEEGGFVGECLEIPGCMSQGETEAEVERNLRGAIDECLSVMFEDSLKEAFAGQDLGSLNLVGISKQIRVPVRAPHLAATA